MYDFADGPLRYCVAPIFRKTSMRRSVDRPDAFNDDARMKRVSILRNDAISIVSAIVKSASSGGGDA